jgi:hypothetical protein
MTIVEDIGFLLGASAFMGFCYLYALLADRMVSHR